MWSYKKCIVRQWVIYVSEQLRILVVYIYFSFELYDLFVWNIENQKTGLKSTLQNPPKNN